MNDSEQRQGSAPEALDVPVSVNSSRRRFTRAGLSGSVVLGSLVSKPVLGAVPYHCTVSGQVSGNLSRPGLATACVLGQSSLTWLNAASWTSPFVKGTPPSNNCSFSGNVTPSVPRVRGTNFNGYSPGPGVPQLNAVFFNAAIGTGQSQSCSVTLTSSNNPATMLQVLASPGTGEQFDLGRAVVTSLLNAATLGTAYPVTTHTIIAMFNATFAGGSYPVAPGKSWTRARVIDYLESLYPQ